MDTSMDDKLILTSPASWWGERWREALPSGNGKIGAAVYGAIQEETIMLSHEELWHRGIRDPLPDVAYTLPEVRRLMDERRYPEANSLMTDALKKKGYNSRLASRFPLADLKLRMSCDAAFKNYQRQLNMATGEVTVAWRDGLAAYVRRLFVSRAHDVMVYEISVEGAKIKGKFELALHRPERPSSSLEDYERLAGTMQTESKGEYLYYAAENEDGTDFGVVLRIIASEGSVSASADGLNVQGATRVLVLARVFVNGERRACWSRLKQELSDLESDFDELLTAHVALHRQLYNSVELRLGESGDNRSNEALLLDAYTGEASTALVRKMWAYGRYLFISGTHEHGQPFGMYGLWGGDYRLIWGHNMANINVQMMYWHAAPGGLSELIPPWMNYYEKMMDDFRTNARQLFGCRGVYIPAGTTPGIGVPNQIVPVIMNWTGAAGWLAQHFYDYYRYTGDQELLRDRVLPFMKDVALFYEDFLVRGEDGLYQLYPSVSPENTPANYMPTQGERALNHPMPTTINATGDFSILKELLTHLLEGSRIAGMYIDEHAKWEDMLTRIPPYQINEDGAVREWMHEDFADNDDHRHLSHTYPIFPGREILKEENPELFASFETAVTRRQLGAQSGWSLMYMASMHARLGEGNRALACLDILARSCLMTNFFTLHNDWRQMGVCLDLPEAPIQLDANMGWVNAVQEMLLYSSPSIIKLLPALPDRWDTGSISHLRFFTGHLSLSWDKTARSLSAQLTAERSTRDLILVLPDEFTECIVQGEGVMVGPSTLGPGSYTITMGPGSTLKIQSRIPSNT